MKTQRSKSELKISPRSNLEASGKMRVVKVRARKISKKEAVVIVKFTLIIER